MATGSYLTPNHSRSQSEIQGDLHIVIKLNSVAQQPMRTTAYCLHLNICDIGCQGARAEVPVRWSDKREIPSVLVPKQTWYSFINPLKG
ncbi:hypothetical protein TNCV_230371 [Trichonephila clavipes]|nr:hypothetical protein TNCV_230371 [Trichonephila clavipes]